MKALRLHHPGRAEQRPLRLEEIPPPVPGPREVRIRVRACGVCRTDLHLAEGDIPAGKLPLIPGHQIVGIVESAGPGVRGLAVGERVGVPWLFSACGACSFCRAGRENLCGKALFTGCDVDGGYAEYVVAGEDAAYPLPPSCGSDAQAAPLLCGGVIGLRALRLSGIEPGGVMGLYGFGASAHIALQILLHWRCRVFVFTRSTLHRELALSLGAAWAGGAQDPPPELLDAAVIFAPSGDLVRAALSVMNRGAALALAGIHMTPIPPLEYRLLYHERSIRSVANSTRADVRSMLELAEAASIRTRVETLPLEDANQGLRLLKESRIAGSAVLLA
ncbi:MAG: zinc-dependent alcohol dehydrogenase family protein [Bacteroidota bacterium]